MTRRSSTLHLACAGALATLLSTCPALEVGAGDTPVGAFRGTMTTDYPEWFKDSFLEFADDVAEAAREGRRVMIIFHQDNCPYCNALVERNFSQKHIEEKVRKHFDVIALDMWGDRDVVTVDGESFSEKALARALRIQFTPTILIFDEDGKVALRLNGYLPPEQFEAALDYAARRMETRLDYNEYLSRAVADKPGEEIFRQDFCLEPPVDLSVPDPGGRPVAVLFEQRHCPNCDLLHREVLSDPTTRAVAQQLRCIQLDMWSQARMTLPSGEALTAREWARRLEVKYAPTIVLFDQEGREVIRSEAYLKAFHTQSILDYVGSGAYRTEPEFQRYLADRTDRIRSQGKDVDIWK